MKNTLEHFADHAPQDIREHLKALAEYAAENLDTSFGRWLDAWGEARIGEVWGKDPGGFIPFQLGGYDVSLAIRFDTDTSYHLTPGMSKEADRLQRMALDDFLQDKKLPADFDLWTDEHEALRDEYFDYENSIFKDGALLQFECWLDGKPYDSSAPIGDITLRVSVNYEDGPYFRSKYAEDMHQLSLSVDALREAVKRWPDDWQARLWRELLTHDAEGNKKGLDNVD